MEPKPVDSETGRQLFFAGTIMAILNRPGTPDPVELNRILDKIDTGLLQSYLDTKPKGFRYIKQCQQVIKMALDRKASN